MKHRAGWWSSLLAWMAWLNGDIAYRAYCAARAHADPDCRHPPPSRRDFYRAELERRWNGVRRCC
ncbi:MAG: putative selenoprotein [Gammaproteobacteria bacterium]|nr:putative selenoprotein [Gammaproteobacteria bacterium]